MRLLTDNLFERRASASNQHVSVIYPKPDRIARYLSLKAYTSYV